MIFTLNSFIPQFSYVIFIIYIILFEFVMIFHDFDD